MPGKTQKKSARAAKQVLPECADGVVLLSGGNPQIEKVDGETIEADAVVCAVPGTKVTDLIPDLPAETRRALSTVNYSTGCRVVIGLDHARSPPAGTARSTRRTTTLRCCWTGPPSCPPPGKGILDSASGATGPRS